MGPVDRGPQRLLPGRQVARPGQEVEAPLESRGERRRREQLHARRGQLDRQRQPVEPRAHRGDRGGVVGREREARDDGTGALHEERDGGRSRELRERRQLRPVRHRERRHRHLALAVQAQRRLARDEHLQAIGPGEQRRDVGRGIDHALEAVQHQQRGGPERPRQRVAQPARALRARLGAQAEAARDLRDDPGRVLDPRERDEAHAPGELAAQLLGRANREARLTGAPGAGERDEPRLGPEQQLADLRPLRLAPHERRARERWRAHARGEAQPARRRELLDHAEELVRQLARRGVTTPRLLGEAALDQPLQRRRQGDAVERRRRIAKDGGDRAGVGGVLERPAPRRHLVQHHPERELVAAVVDLAALRLLGRHVGHGSEHRAGRGEGCGGGRLVVAARLARRARLDASEPEVEHLGAAVRRDDHVLRLQVAVDDALGVRGGERVRHLGADRQQPLDRQAARREQAAQALPVDELHHDVVIRRRRPELVDRHDVRVVERGGRLRLELEPRHEARVAGPGLGQRLERDLPLQPRVARAIDLAHAPGPEGLKDLVSSQPSSRGERHASRCLRSQLLRL